MTTKTTGQAHCRPATLPAPPASAAGFGGRRRPSQPRRGESGCGPSPTPRPRSSSRAARATEGAAGGGGGDGGPRHVTASRRRQGQSRSGGEGGAMAAGPPAAAAPPWRGLPLLLLLLAAVEGPGAGEPPPPRLPPDQLCEGGGGGCCAGAPAARTKGSPVADFCRDRSGAALRGRCCVDDGASVVVGLDWGNCSLTRLCSSFREASAAIVIDLTSNPLQELPEDLFRGFTQLQTLVLPWHLDCPGGSEGWGNISVRGSSRSCHSQRNPCNGSAGLVWLCPEASLCTPDGPGLFQCLCMSPYHGYKCLRQGSFPVLLFFGTLSAITATLSILLWVTQRRKAKTL